MSRVLLVNMPFGNLRWPHLGLGLLKALLTQRGIDCDTAYFNFDFAEHIGLETYHWLADHFAFVLGGERLFAKHYFRDFLPADADYYRNVLLAADPEMTEADHAAFLDAGRCVEPFLDQCIKTVDWSRYDIVGFTNSFQQTMPSVCLARRIKQLRPETIIALGGSACEGCMGRELLAQFPEVDCVFSGEADQAFPEAVLRWSQEPRNAMIQSREINRGVAWNLDAVENLDQLPYPDFDDYFARLQRSPLRNEIDPLLFFETSRGCWWGKKRRCAFCGLNGDRLGYRVKSPTRVVDELRHLVERYHIRRACAADNVLDLRYCESLLPMLKSEKLGLSFAFEMKTNLTRQQANLLCEAGLGAAQLGIETFSTPILRQIGKGATAMQNLQALRWFSEAGIEAEWNLLYGFPGEDPREYANMADLLPSLFHLAPPQMAGPVRIDRFAPYFDDPQRFGVENLRPNRAFAHVYPFSRDVLDRLAYYFEFDYADRRNPLDYVRPVVEAAETWKNLRGAASLRYWDRPDGVLILTDTRPCAQEFQYRLTGIERAIYLYCDSGRSLRQIVEYAAESSDKASSPSSIAHLLDGWVSARLMAHLDGRYLSLATKSPSA